MMTDEIDLNALVRLLPQGWWLRAAYDDDAVYRLTVGSGDTLVLVGYRRADSPRRRGAWHFLRPSHSAPWGMVKEIRHALRDVVEVQD